MLEQLRPSYVSPLVSPLPDEISVSLDPLRDEVAPLPALRVRKADLQHTSPPPFPMPERYLYHRLLGRGGMGEVHRVFDRYLNRTMAMKVIQSRGAGSPERESRFLAEAQATAQLQHPGIVPVFDIGKLSDGRYYFTMKEVQGQTLKEVIREVHLASPEDHWETSASGWSFRRLIDTLLRVCEAMAYAHERGVVHRDLKPSNIMVGRYGEVLVMDWGLAKVRGSEERAGVTEELQPIQTVRTDAEGLATRAGRVAGTVAYMPPEQARGEVERLSASSDVYSLGAVLYEILSGRPPFSGSDGWNMLEQVQRGGWRPPRRGRLVREETDAGDASELIAPTVSPSAARDEGPPVPEELLHICERALSLEPSARYSDAGAMGEAIRTWVEQARRRERGVEALEQVKDLPSREVTLRTRAKELRDEAQALLSKIPGWESIEKKKPGWALEDEAARLEQEADLEVIRYTQGVRGALTQDPLLPEAHAALARFYHSRHVEAEAQRDARATAQWELLLREHDRRGDFAAYLKGDGAVTLVTDPSPAEVTLFRYETEDRRLVPRFVKSLGQTPLRAVPLEKGSYLLKVQAPGRVEVNYPVFIGRGEHWDGVPPEGGVPYPILLPKPEELGPEDCYVPAGWFWAGGDPAVPCSLTLQRVWVDACVIRRFPVRNREYLRFLNDLLVHGCEIEAQRLAPHERTSLPDLPGAVLFGRDQEGQFCLDADAEGDIWDPDWAVTDVDWYCACAFAQWTAYQSRQPWRLSYELEWEKGGRGVDARRFPWGDVIDPSWVSYRESHQGRPLPPQVDSFPVDQSVYGIRGMAGLVQEWCLDEYCDKGPVHAGRVVYAVGAELKSTQICVYRGGYWSGAATDCHLAYRFRFEAHLRFAFLGFRLARSYP